MAGPVNAGVRPGAARRLWRRTLRLTGVLLALWFGVTFGIGFFARDLAFTLFGWPFGGWVAGQGALLVYVAIVWLYAGRMDRLDADAARRTATD